MMDEQERNRLIGSLIMQGFSREEAQREATLIERIERDQTMAAVWPRWRDRLTNRDQTMDIRS